MNERTKERLNERTLGEESEGLEGGGVSCELGLGWTKRTANIQRNVQLGVDALFFFYFWFLSIPPLKHKDSTPPSLVTFVFLGKQGVIINSD